MGVDGMELGIEEKVAVGCSFGRVVDGLDISSVREKREREGREGGMTDRISGRPGLGGMEVKWLFGAIESFCVGKVGMRACRYD